MQILFKREIDLLNHQIDIHSIDYSHIDKPNVVYQREEINIVLFLV